MNKRYTILPKNFLQLCMATAVATSFAIDLQAQSAPPRVWDRCIGGGLSEDKLSSYLITADGGHLLIGRSDGPASDDKTQPLQGLWYPYNGDIWIVKLDASKTVEWDKDYGGEVDDIPSKVKQTSDGGYILAGNSKSGVNGNKFTPNKGLIDYWLIKLSPTGAKTWEKSFGSNFDDKATDVLQTADGGYIIGGYSSSVSNSDKSQASKGSNDYWIIKTDANGNKLWDKTIGGSGNDLFSAIVQTPDGGYLLGGRSGTGINGDKTQASKGGDDFWLVKLDGSGNKLWDKSYGGSSTDILVSIKPTSHGGFILGGESYSGISGDKTQANKGGGDYWIVKIDAAGNKLWDKTLGGSNLDQFVDLEQTPDGGYILGGYSVSNISGDKSQANYDNFNSPLTNDYWAVKLDANGNKLWDRTMGGTNEDVLAALQQMPDGGIVFAGSSKSLTNVDKTEQRKNLSNPSFDFWLIKLGGNVNSIKEVEVETVISVFPNPNKGKFALKLSNISSSNTEIIISDLLGRTIQKRIIQPINNQISEAFDIPGLKGIYQLQVTAGQQVLTQRIVVE